MFNLKFGSAVSSQQRTSLQLMGRASGAQSSAFSQKRIIHYSHKMFFYFLVYQKMLIVKSGVWIIEILLVSR